MKTATLITIGDELLIGQVTDTNSGWMARELHKIGIRIRRRIAIADIEKAIIETLDEELPKADILIMTGGLGPTADDITKPALAKYFGQKMRVDEDVLKHVEAYFEKRKKPMLKRNRMQAEVPDKCTVLHNALGTAPGMWFEKGKKVVAALPGVPHEMIHLMEKQVLPRIKKAFPMEKVHFENMVLGGEGESFIAEKIRDIEESMPDYIRLAYLPSLGMLRLRLTSITDDRKDIAKEMRQWRDKIARRLSDYLITKKDIALQQVLAELLEKNKLKLALAESCSGGYISHLQTQIPGSSGWLQGSIVCYQPGVKIDVVKVKAKTIETKGIVSEQVALEMARGTRKVLKADIGFGITGWLDGEGDEFATGGTVCMAVVMEGKEASRTFQFASRREQNKELAVQNAFLFMIRFLTNKLTKTEKQKPAEKPLKGAGFKKRSPSQP